MMRLPCPWCGECDEVEFVFGGPSDLMRPTLDSTDQQWGAYLYFRDNVRGQSGERWRHAYGCGQWFNLTRDSLTHEVTAVRKLGDGSS